MFRVGRSRGRGSGAGAGSRSGAPPRLTPLRSPAAAVRPPARSPLWGAAPAAVLGRPPRPSVTPSTYDIGHEPARLLPQVAGDVAGRLEPGRLPGDLLRLADRDGADDLLNLGGVERRDAQLPQAHPQQQQRVDRLAAHLATDVHADLRLFAGVQHPPE